jgi:hypothetical protein
VFVGNFGVSEILSKLRRKAAERLDKTKDAVGAFKGEFLTGLREEPKKGEPVVVRAERSEGARSRPKRWGRRSR